MNSWKYQEIKVWWHVLSEGLMVTGLRPFNHPAIHPWIDGWIDGCVCVHVRVCA